MMCVGSPTSRGKKITCIKPTEDELDIKIIKEFKRSSNSGKIKPKETLLPYLKKKTKLSRVLDIIKDLEKEYGEQIPVEELLETLKEQGIPEYVYKEMKKKGMLYEPKPGYFKRF